MTDFRCGALSLLAALTIGLVATGSASPRFGSSTFMAAATTVKIGAAPLALTIAEGSLWVLAENNTGAVVLRLNPTTGARERIFYFRASPGPDMGGIAFGQGRIWAAAGGHVLRIDPSDPSAVVRMTVPGIATAIAAGFGSVWVTTIGQQRDLLTRLNPRSLAITARIRVGTSGPHAVIAGLGSVWVASGAALLRVNPRSDRIAAQLAALSPVDLALAQDRIWTLAQSTVTSLNPAGRVTNQIPVPFGGGSFAIAEGRLWITDNCGCRQGMVAEIALADKRLLATEPTGETPVAITADRSQAWVANFADATLSFYANR